MARSNYIIKKLRFCRVDWDPEDIWGPWEYEAVSESPDYEASNPAERGITARYQSIDGLAKELATFPDIDCADLFSDPIGQHVSLADCSKKRRTMSQNSPLTADELGELASRIVEYLQMLK